MFRWGAGRTSWTSIGVRSWANLRVWAGYDHAGGTPRHRGAAECSYLPVQWKFSSYRTVGMFKNRRLALFAEAVAAVDRSVAARLEGEVGLLPAGGAGGHEDLARAFAEAAGGAGTGRAAFA